MKVEIKICPEKKLIGVNKILNFANYTVAQLWQDLRAHLSGIKNRIDTDLISLAIYPSTFFEQFNATTPFQRWATVTVDSFEEVPHGLHTFVLQAGLYAVFYYKGSSADHSVFNYIYQTWLPQSDYLLDDRPHFEMLGTSYKPNDANAEEEIWIPIKEKK
jgi:AraC family transcriptional regulator